MLNSTCSLKSVNFCSVTMSTHGTLFEKVPSAALQQLPRPLLRRFQPERSFPLKSGMGLPHLGGADRCSFDARTAVHVKDFPSDSVVPTSLSPTSLPLKTRSPESLSYCTGALNDSSPSW